MKKTIIIFTLLFTIIVQTLYASVKPKYIFYFIGDGMGMSHTHITEAYLKAAGEQELSFLTFPALGIANTECYGRLITDSAAAGTALSTGTRTTDGMIGMSHDTIPLENISTTLQRQGKKIGIISTASIDHATPAAFYAHQPSRNMYFEISEELPTHGFNFIGGGGILNNKNFAETASKYGYKIAGTKEAITNLKNGEDKIIAISPKLQDENSMTYAIDRKEGEITLANIVGKGIEVLDNPNGFFMMVEGGKIDWLAHAGDIGSVIREVKDFDNAVRVALEFYHKHPKETLIIVTADHETGGFAMGGTLKKYDSDYLVYKEQKTSYYTFSNEVIEYRDNGPKIKDINYITKLLQNNFGINNLNDTEMNAVKEAFVVSMTPNKDRVRDNDYKVKYGSYDPITVVGLKILAQRAGVGTTTFYHTAAPVFIQSIGVGSQEFNGRLENKDIPTKILQIAQ